MAAHLSFITKSLQRLSINTRYKIGSLTCTVENNHNKTQVLFSNSVRNTNFFNKRK